MSYYIFWNHTCERAEAVKAGNREHAKKLIERYHNSDIRLSFRFRSIEFPYKLNPYYISYAKAQQLDIDQQIKYPKEF